jgi:hypothetical protein
LDRWYYSQACARNTGSRFRHERLCAFLRFFAFFAFDSFLEIAWPNDKNTAAMLM